ncbi:MAG TPA: PAS domain S-box protein [Bacteroidales bacterium]|nr:PAS domain S-box protein [Bacteroidales bacterium]
MYKLVLRSFATGFLTGLAVLLISLSIGLFSKDLPFTISGVLELHKSNPSMWILDILPFALGFLFYYIGNDIQRRLSETQAKLKNELSKSQKTLDFTQHLIQDKLSAGFEVGEDDQIGKALINLRDNLVKNKSIEISRRKEDDQRNWVAEGLAKFSEILRKNNDNLNDLAYSIIHNLVKYINANQAGFFILQEQDDDKYFEMSACYAYDRKKFADKRISWGDGLIGTCALERKTIYMTNIPNEYVTITSGLGKATPSCLLIVPLIVNDGIHGVLEIASFKKFEPFEIEFVEKVAESIASTISTVKINVRTARLLKESQEQAEILASQEEQMRQNMEELQATQEEAARQNEKFISFTNSVNHTLIRAEFLSDGTLIYANNKFIQKLGYNDKTEVEGRQVSMFINKKDKELFDQIWQDIIRGKEHFEGDIKLQTRQGKDLWTMATLTPQKKDDEVDRIIFLAIDTTDQKKQSLDFEAQIEAMNRSSLKAEITPEGDILDCNEKFLITFGFTPEEISNKTFIDLIAREEISAFKEIWDNVLNGVPFQGQIKSITKSNEEKWFRGTLSVVNDMYGEVNKVIYITNDITKEKLMEIESQHQTEQLKIQEEKLRQSGAELSRKLEKAKAEMELQYKEVEKVKIRNERTLEGALDAIVTINQEGRIEFFNKAAEDLWGLPRKETIGMNVKVLFSEANIQEDEFTKAYVTPGGEKIIGQRKEIKITNKNGDDIPVLFLLSEARVDDENTYTAFIQNIEVELF